jgi:transcriptional regulator with PAS, ATPase and Fis domain
MPQTQIRAHKKGIDGASPTDVLFDADALRFVERVAGVPEPVLILGETGVGKGIFARLIHERSDRAARTFKAVNCGGIPETLFEREMFGHVRGAFTDARSSERGLLEFTDGGTLFLDELGEMPVGLQPKLLAVLEDGYVRRVGSLTEIPIDVRVIAATNRDLDGMRRRQAFRDDLYYRLSFFTYRIPPLRERLSKLEAVVELMLVRTLARRSCARPAVHRETMEALKLHSWPGNLRELDQVLRFAITFAEGPILLPSHLPAYVRQGSGASGPDGALPVRSRYIAPGDARNEKSAVQQALESCAWNRRRAAERLGMSRTTLWARMREYGFTDGPS